MNKNKYNLLNSVFSVVFIFTMVFSSFASLPVSAFAESEEFIQDNMFFGADGEEQISNTESQTDQTKNENTGTDTEAGDIVEDTALDTSTDTNFSITETAGISQENQNNYSSLQSVLNSSLSVEKLVKNVTDSTEYSKQVNADFGEVVRFKLLVTNTGSAKLTDLYISEVLPDRLAFIDGTLSVPEPVYGGNIFSPDGLSIHDLNSGEFMVITFDAKVADSSAFNIGETILTANVNLVETGGTPAEPDTDTASVRVIKQDVIVTPPTNGGGGSTTTPPVDVCTEIKDKNGWYGKYYDYNSSHPNMEESASTWSVYYGDPLSKETTWTTDWYDSKYFKLGKVDSNLIFNDNFFPLDSVSGAEIINGHNYHFGVHWKAKVMASSSKDYTFRLDSDDDAWVYIDGKLVADNRGVHPLMSTTSSVYLAAGDHIAEIFFAERHTVRSNMYFKFSDTSLKITPFVDGCEVINTPPTITLVGANPLFLTVGDMFVDPGATAIDTQDGNLTSSIVVSGSVSTSTLGTTTLIYSVHDSGGLGATTTREVVVLATTTPPVVKPQCSDGLDNDGDGKIDSLDPGCHSDGNVGNDSSFDPNDNSEVDVPSNPPTDNGGGNGGGGGGSSSGGRRRDVSNLFSSGGEILGASSCSYLRDYLRIDWANDKIEVLKLQSFLNIYNGANLTLTGVFDQNTLVAVNNFQNKYESDILTPWGHDAPTGFVYILTKKKINEIYCNTTYPLTSEQAKEISEFRAFLDSIKTNNPNATYDASGIGGDLEGAVSSVVIINQNGEVVVDSLGTTTKDNLVKNSFSSSVLGNAAVSIFAVPDSVLEGLRCFIAFIIILLVMYIVSGILTNGRKERRIVFLVLSVIAIIVSILVNFYCVVLPLLLTLIISALLIILDKDNGNDLNSGTGTGEVIVETVEKVETKEEASVIEMPGEIVVESDEEEIVEPIVEEEKTKN